MLIELDVADVVVGCYVEAIIAQQGNYKLTSGQWIANEQVIRSEERRVGKEC